MYSKSVLNVFDLGHYNLLEGLYPLQSGHIKTAPKYQYVWETTCDVRIIHFSRGNAVITQRGEKYIVRQNDVFFLFPGRSYTLSADANTVCEVWWVDVQGLGIKKILNAMSVSPQHPMISGITNPAFAREFQTIATYADDHLPSDTLCIAGCLFKICALMLDACTTSEWITVPYTNNSIIYTGNWSTWPSPTGTMHQEIYTSTVKSYAEYNFYGTGIRWYGTMNFDCGKADVIIDGNYQTTVDTYSPERLTHQLLFTDMRLAEGYHIIKIFCVNKKNDMATNCDIVIDAFQYFSKREEEADNSLEYGLCKKATEIIKSTYCQDISLDVLAKQLNVSRSYLTSKFKNEIGLSPTQYIRNIRMRRAQHLLRTTDLSINEVAATIGFSDAFYFSRLFKLEENVSPSQYRQLHRNDAETVNDPIIWKE